MAQLTNPLPSLMDSGLEIELEEWLTIPASSGSNPRARINHIKPCPDGVRLFCNDLRGKLWVIANNQASNATLFLDLTDHFSRFVDAPGLGTGFGSFAFHPEFFTMGAPGFGKFYTGSVENPEGTPPADFAGPLNPNAIQHGVVTEWTMTNPADNAISTNSVNFTKRELLRVEFPLVIHGLQEMAMDPNAVPGDENYGCLFICVGDGGSISADVPRNTGRIDSILGTILRIVPILSTGQSASDYTTSGNGAYLVPNSNPFVASADPTPGDGFGTLKEIYAYGFRNPHRICWDSGGTGKMFCGLIGEDNIEEIELIESGGHYGWPDREGNYLFDPNDPNFVFPLPSPDSSPPDSPPAPTTYSYPVAQLDHQDSIAIAGGYVYRGTQIPELFGMYICGGVAWGKLFVVPEADLFLEQPTASGESPGTLQNLGLRNQGSPTTFLNVLGTSRADLRFGIDHSGELFLLSKQNGTIYRVTSVHHEFVSDVSIMIQPNSVTVPFPTATGKTYRVWTSENLTRWTLTSNSISGNGNQSQWIDSQLDDIHFYRIEENQP